MLTISFYKRSEQKKIKGFRRGFTGMLTISFYKRSEQNKLKGSEGVYWDAYDFILQAFCTKQIRNVCKIKS